MLRMDLVDVESLPKWPALTLCIPGKWSWCSGRLWGCLFQCSYKSCEFACLLVLLISFADSLLLIWLCLADDVMYCVMILSSLVEVWRKLDCRYMSKFLTNKLYLKQKFYSLKIQKGADLLQHINIFNHTVSGIRERWIPL